MKHDKCGTCGEVIKADQPYIVDTEGQKHHQWAADCDG